MMWEEKDYAALKACPDRKASELSFSASWEPPGNDMDT